MANVLFVDNPVGTGYSYVTEDSAYTTDVDGIATDLMTLFSAFLTKYSVFEVCWMSHAWSCCSNYTHYCLSIIIIGNSFLHFFRVLWRENGGSVCCKDL